MKLFLSIYWDSANISWYKWWYDLNTANKLPLALSLECIFQTEKKRYWFTNALFGTMVILNFLSWKGNHSKYIV